VKCDIATISSVLAVQLLCCLVSYN